MACVYTTLSVSPVYMRNTHLAQDLDQTATPKDLLVVRTNLLSARPSWVPNTTMPRQPANPL